MIIKGNSVAPQEKRDFPVIPPGIYLCKVLEVKVKSSEKVGDYWNLQLEIQDGPFEGKMVFDSLYFTPKGLNRFYLVWKRLTGMELDRTADLDVDETDLIGCKAMVTVGNKAETYQGETKIKAKVIYDGYAEIGAVETVKTKKSPKEEMADDDMPY